MPCRTHFSQSWMQRSIISNEKVSYLYLGVLPENSWMSFLHCTSHYSLRKSLKDLSDHLNFFVSCQGRSQLSPAIFRASRNHLVASKQSYMLKLSKSVVSQGSVKANLTHDLIYIIEKSTNVHTQKSIRKYAQNLWTSFLNTFTAFPEVNFERNRIIVIFHIIYSKEVYEIMSKVGLDGIFMPSAF